MKQILPTEDASKISVRAHKNLIYLLNGFQLRLLEIPRIFNNCHLQPELLLLRAEVILKTIRYPALLDKMHLYYGNSQESKKEERRSLLANILPTGLRMRRREKQNVTDPAPRDLLGLTLPYNTDFHLDRQNVLIANCLRLLEDLLKHYALLPERMSFKLLRTVVPSLKDLAAGCTRHLSSCKTVHLLTSLRNCARIDQRKNLLRITGILTLSSVRSFLARPGVSQSEIGHIISSLEHISHQVDLIYCQEKGQHRLLFSTFLYLYNFLRKAAVARNDGRSRLDEMAKKVIYFI